MRRFLFFAGLFLLLLTAHLFESGVLWEGETLPLASAMQMMHGGVLYRDIWFDKPLLVPAVYLLWGAHIGPALRIAGAIYALIVCGLGYALAASLWSRREGYLAAALLAFFLTFDTHSAVLPLAADMLLVAPHLAAVLLAVRKQPLWSGVAAGVGFLFNTKGVFVLAACALFLWPGIGSLAMLAAGFVIPNAIALAWLAGTGSLIPFIDQVWRWPARYAASPVVSDPVRNGLIRTVNWLGFHAVLLIGAMVVWLRTRWRFLAWALLCYAGVALGWRFFPRYFLLLLPVLAITAARGLAVLRNRTVLAIAALTMIVPLVRFAPRYVTLNGWSDLAMDQDSKNASALALSLTANKADPTLYVWGYRPEMYIYTRFAPATKFLDSQALTGVPADRHLTQSDVVLTAGTREARLELAASHPDILIDGLSLYNPALSPDHYPELQAWLRNYQVMGRTNGSIVYVRRPNTIVQ
ncbi:MAG TPA: hypothetical protein VG273_17680 [Bryobacteraceae bacterium]|nr:hypothetical protein [Bryobacteraceae bacterium]